MQDFNWVPVLVALLGGGGLTAAAQQFYNMIKLSREGVSGREDQRRMDIIGERDYAINQLAISRDNEREAEHREDEERQKRIHAQEEAARLRLRLITLGADGIDATTPSPPRVD